MENINITFTGITDYLRDKDNEIDYYKRENTKYINICDKLQEKIYKAIEYIKEHYPTSTMNVQDDKRKLLNILEGSDVK